MLSTSRPLICSLAASVMLVSCVLSLTACGGSADITPAPQATDSNPGNYSAVTISDAQIEVALEKLDTIAQRDMERSGVPGMAIAVVFKDKLVYAKGFGVRQAGSFLPVDEHTVFQLASISKPVGATVVAGVVGDKHAGIHWDSRVVDFLPGFRLADDDVTAQLTLADLYSHRSGLPDHAGDLLESIGYDRTAILHQLRYYPLAPFRTEHLYTNFGLTAAAQAVANAENTSWEALSQQRLYARIGMESTSSTFADFMAKENKALGNVLVDGVWLPTPSQRQPDEQSPAGGVSSNVMDMARWMRLILNKGRFSGEQVIDAEALHTALSVHSNMPTAAPDSRPAAYGLGFGIGVDASGRTRFSHSGGFSLGAGTVFNLMPKEELGIVVLTNGFYGLAEAVASGFMDTVILGEEAFDWLELYAQRFAPLRENPSRLAGKSPPSNPAPALPLSAYLGQYGNELYGLAEIVPGENGQLSLHYGPQPQRFALAHWDANTFSYLPIGEEALGISAIDFALDADNRVVSMTIEFLNEHNLGTFVRR